MSLVKTFTGTWSTAVEGSKLDNCRALDGDVETGSAEVEPRFRFDRPGHEGGDGVQNSASGIRAAEDDGKKVTVAGGGLSSLHPAAENVEGSSPGEVERRPPSAHEMQGRIEVINVQ